jgi:hypothetical protein
MQVLSYSIQRTGDEMTDRNLDQIKRSLDSISSFINATAAPIDVEITPQAVVTKFSGAIVGAAGATLSYLADGGFIGAVNQTAAIRYPTSARTAKRLRVNSISNSAAHTVTCTLYKNGVATPLVISIPAGSAANTKFSLDVNVAFVDGDDFDLRLDDVGDIGAVVNVTAAIEWQI